MSKYDSLWEYIKINAPWELSFNEVRQICGFSIKYQRELFPDAGNDDEMALNARYRLE